MGWMCLIEHLDFRSYRVVFQRKKSLGTLGPLHIILQAASKEKPRGVYVNEYLNLKITFDVITISDT